MPTVKGLDAVHSMLAALPQQLAEKVLPGAARAAANVIAEEARSRSVSKEVTAAIKVRVTKEDVRIVGKVQVRGKGAYLAPWLEYGTKGHFITVDDSQREGRTAGRINRLDKAAREEGRAGPGDAIRALKINGKFVGTTVWHPGADAHPFMRVSLDVKEKDAVRAAQAYINSRVAQLSRTGVIAGGDGGQ
ncbi:MAG: HK97 gp10 family phage protein [Sphingomonadales bacterium]|nr:HK97 gp10 family phage protein [Sphingomonadales bacterium]